MDKQIAYIGLGIGLFTALVIYNSTRKLELVEVVDPTQTDTKSFDHASLPVNLKPPYRLADGEPLMTARRKGINGISFKPRFDR